MDPQAKGYFQHPEDDGGPYIPDLIRGVPLPTVSKTISILTEILTAQLRKEPPGGMVVIQELKAAFKEKGLRCWQFSFGESNVPYVMECAEECTLGVSNFLHDEGQDKISSVQFGLEAGSISDPRHCKLALSAQGFDDPLANEALIAALARYFQWIDNDLVKQIGQLSNNHLTEQLLCSKLLSR